MSEHFNFNIKSARPPILEITDEGIYFRFQEDVEVANTVIRNEWPHVAIDLDKSGRIIGIETVPKPDRFSIAEIFAQAGVDIPPNFSVDKIEILPSLKTAAGQKTAARA